MQLIKTLKIITVIASLFIGSQTVNAQTTDALGAYSPYSMFGLGEIEKPGTAYSRGMGGIGISMRDNRFINYINPAAISARDTLAFMLDFGVAQKNNYLSDANATSAYNTFNMLNFIVTFPIYRKSAFIIGIVPFSNTGYKFESIEQNPDLVAQMGDIKYQQYGTGGISQLFVGASMVFAKNFSVGAEFLYYFGSINRQNNTLFSTSANNNSIQTGWDYDVRSYSGKFGIQYEQPLKNNSFLSFGATYRLGSNLQGDITNYNYSISQGGGRDTISFGTYQDTKIRIASEIGVGISYKKKDKWSIGFDYLRQDWNKTEFKETSRIFSPLASESFKAGFEIIPNRYDSRYYLKRVTYRGGAYFDRSYVSINGHQINDCGITFGASFPIFRWYNAIGVAVEIGQRGTQKNNLVRENYVNFIVNISLHDIWFQKYKYE